MVAASTVNAYQRWIAQALQTLDENRVDMEVSLVVNVVNGDNDQYGVKHSTKIRVRESGQASDFSNWSPMFSPGGFRMLGIMAIGKHVAKRGGSVNPSYGQALDYGKWTVDYNETENLMVIGNSDGREAFPEFEMTEKLRSLLTMLSG
jgi:hypothetical protein